MSEHVMHVYIHIGMIVVCLVGMLYECLAFGYGSYPWLKSSYIPGTVCAT